MSHTKIPIIPIRHLVAGTLAVTAVIAIFWLLLHFHGVLLLFLAAIIISIALKPGVNWLAERNLPKPAGLLVIYGIIVIVLGLLVWLSVPILTEQGRAIITSLQEGYQLLREWLLQIPNVLVLRLVASLPEELALTNPATFETAVNAAGGAETAASAAGEAESPLAQIWNQTKLAWEAIFNLTAIVILAFFWTMDGERVKQAAFLLVPINKRVETRELVDEIETRISRFVLGQGFLCLVIALVSFVAYLLIGLPNALLLAIFAGILEAVPLVGPFLGAVPAVVVGLTISPMTAVWVLVATAVIQQLEGNLLVPRVMDRAVGVRPLVTLLALLAFGSLFGVLGALMALPLVSVVQLLIDRFLFNGEDQVQAEIGRDHLGVLRYETNQLVQDVRQQIRQKADEPSAMTDQLEDEVEAIALGLENILASLGTPEEPS